MKRNGDAFQAFTGESACFLAGKKALDYYREPLPSPSDARIEAMVDRFKAASNVQRAHFLSTLNQAQRSLFGIYGHRAATLSVREAAGERLAKALLGAVIANYVIPSKRRVEVALAVYHHCSRQLGLNTVDLFDEAAEFAAPELADQLRSFGRRSDVTLRQYGWRETKTPEGVRYTFSWG